MVKLHMYISLFFIRDTFSFIYAMHDKMHLQSQIPMEIYPLSHLYTLTIHH